MQQNWHGTVGNFYRSNIGSNIGLDSPEYFQGLWGDRNTANFDDQRPGGRSYKSQISRPRFIVFFSPLLMSMKRKAASSAEKASKKSKSISLEQISWSEIWKQYMSVVNNQALVNNNGSNSIYDLLVQVTRIGVTLTFHEKDPCRAMYEAKVLHSKLSGVESENALKCAWRWSPQSLKARQYLAKTYIDSLPFDKFPALSESKRDQQRLVKMPPTKAFQAGWRWFPVPSPRTKSHNMRWYPPTTLALEMRAAKVDGVTFKTCSHFKHEISYVTSPMIVKYYRSLGVVLSEEELGKGKKKK